MHAINLKYYAQSPFKGTQPIKRHRNYKGHLNRFLYFPLKLMQGNLEQRGKLVCRFKFLRLTELMLKDSLRQKIPMLVEVKIIFIECS